MRPITASRADGVPIGEISRRTGVHIETIRYYEKIKMLPAPGAPRAAAASMGHKKRASSLSSAAVGNWDLRWMKSAPYLTSAGREERPALRCALSPGVTSTIFARRSPISQSLSAYWVGQSRAVLARRCRIVPCWIFLILNTAGRPASGAMSSEVWVMD